MSDRVDPGSSNTKRYDVFILVKLGYDIPEKLLYIEIYITI